MQTPVIFVLGPPAHGKTAARKLLAELTVQKGDSTSSAIYHFLAIYRGVPVKDLHAIPKEELRPALIEAGDYLVGALDVLSYPPADPEKFAAFSENLYRGSSALIRALYLNGTNIIDGVRRVGEIVSAKDHLEWNGVPHLTIWIEKSQGPVIPDNTELTALNADEVVMNDGTLEDLKVKLFALLEKKYGVQDEITKPVPIAPDGKTALAMAAKQLEEKESQKGVGKITTGK